MEHKLNMPVEIKAMIFDLDGVITKTSKYHYLAWKKLSDELDIYFDEEINEFLKGVDRFSSFEIILKNCNKEFSLEEKKVLVNKKDRFYKSLINSMTPQDLLPGAINVLENLKKRNIKIALASVSHNAFTVIDKLQIRNYFDYIVDATKIRKGKPEPEIFLSAAFHLGTNPINCIGIEDAEVGIRAIKTAGMYAIGIGEKSILKEADEVINSLEELNLDKYIK